MALSLESIFKPVNDFFLNKFKKDEHSLVEFRLLQNGDVITAEDFIEQNNPEEEFSDFVNKIPVLHKNGIHVDFLMNSIDETYALILNALPHVSDEFNQEEKLIIEERVISNRAKAIKDWENAQKVRGGGIADEFSFSDASPENWYLNESKAWEKRTFKIKQPKSTKETTKSIDDKLIKIRMTDEQLLKALPLLKQTKKVKPIDLNKHVFLKTNLSLMAKPTFKPNKPRGVAATFSSPIFAANVKPVLLKPSNIATKILSSQKKVRLNPREQKQASKVVKRTLMGTKFSKAYHGLKLNQKIFVKDYIKQKSPAKKVNTNGISIEFEYCVVNVRRPWYNEALCTIDTSWYIPGLKKGSLNKIGSGSLAYMPIAFVAVKNLRISANWEPKDKEDLEKATSFGPFDINGHSIKESGSISHDGIQVIGWMLQKMPELPPN